MSPAETARAKNFVLALLAMAQFVVVEPGDEPDLGGTDGMAGHDH